MPIRVAYTLEQCWHDVPGGTTVATLELARRIRGVDDVELVGVAGRHRAKPEPEFRPPIEVRQLAIARPWLYETWNRFSWPPVEKATGPVDVCHSTIAIPAATSAPHVVTIHDVAFIHTPERFSRHGARVMRAGLERCRLADFVVCPSKTTEQDLLKLGFEADRIRVVPWGVDTARADADEVRRVRDLYRLPDRFVLFVGTVEPRKNLPRLIEAVAALDDPTELVVVGASGWGDQGLADGVRSLGFVPGPDLRALYAAATVFAYPSLQEGFGLPVAEAMAQGTPVVTSRGTATEEVAGGAAILVDPHSASSITTGIMAALEGASDLSARGLTRAAGMSWDVAATNTIAIYREAAR